MPTFGAYTADASKEAYLDAVGNDPRVTVVVHLYEPGYAPCRRLQKVLAELARRRADVSFLGLRLAEAGAAWDAELLPILAVYRAGEVEGTLFQVGSDLGPAYNHADVESLLDTIPAFSRDPAPLALPERPVVTLS